MGLTTDIYDPSPREIQYAADLQKAKMHNETQLQIAQIQAAAQLEAAGKKQQAPAVPREKQAAAAATTAGAEVGAPTAYAGGAGAPQPIEVIRGMTRTYAQPTQAQEEGRGFVPEYSTGLQAAQAYNREQAALQKAAGPTQADIAAAAEEAKKTGQPFTPQQAMEKRVSQRFGEYVPATGPEISLKAKESGMDLLRKTQAEGIQTTQQTQKESKAVADFTTDMKSRYPELNVDAEKMDKGTAADLADAQAHYKKTNNMEESHQRYLDNREIRTQLAPSLNPQRLEGLFRFNDQQQLAQGKAKLTADREQDLKNMLEGRDMTLKKKALQFLLPVHREYQKQQGWKTFETTEPSFQP